VRDTSEVPQIKFALMRTAIEQLPDDIETLKRLIIERDALVEAKRLEVRRGTAADREAQAADRGYKRIQFGCKSERSRRAGRAARN